MTTATLPRVLRRTTTASAGALLTASIAGLFGIGGFVAVVLGDELIALDPGSMGLALVTLVSVTAIVVARERPGDAAIGFAIAPVTYIAVLGEYWSVWWSRYQEAVAIGGVAENAFWSTQPALGFFVISGAVFAVAAVMAGLNAVTER